MLMTGQAGNGRVCHPSRPVSTVHTEQTKSANFLPNS